MQSLFGLELSTAQKVIVASVVILILLALLGLIVRQIQGGRLRLRGQVAGRQRQPRLGVVDTYDLDRQRQLVLIRRDNIEHLVMIGGSSDVVVETNIMRSGSRAVVPSYPETAIPDRPLPPFETLVPPSEPAIRAGEEARRNAAAPDVLPALPTRPASSSDFAAGAGVAASLGVLQTGLAPAKPAASPGPLPSVATGPAPSFAREHAPQPPVSPGELDDMTRQLEEALKRPFSAVRPAHLPDESPAEIVAPPVKQPAPAPAPVVQPLAAAPKPEPKPAPKVVPAASHIPVMPASPQHGPLPGSVEAELAAALGLSPDHAVARPVEINAPEVRVPEPKAPEPKFVQTRPPEPRMVEPKPVEPRAAEPKPAPASVKPEPQPAPLPVAEPEPELEPISAVVEVEPAVVEAKPEPKPEPAPEPPAVPDPKEIDPFSVDAIEAEFARLLGRDPKAKS